MSGDGCAPGPARPLSSALTPTPFDTRSRPTCLREAPTCERSRSCLDTGRSPPRRFTLAFSRDDSGRHTPAPIRARELERVNTKLEARLRRAPTDEEMAVDLSISVKELQDTVLQMTLTIREIGEILGVTESRVTQLHTKACFGCGRSSSVN